MRQLIRQNLRFFVLCTVAAFALRLFFLRYFAAIVNDSFVYGDIAKNWLQHGIFGLSGTEEVSPTYIRLPGYPAFLGFIFAIFGMEHYRAVLITQILVDVGTCLLCADVALRLFGTRTAKIAYALAAFCPFLASYSAAALTETWEIFFTVLFFDLALRAFQNARLLTWTSCGAACAGAILLRPDGGILLITIEIYLLWSFARRRDCAIKPWLSPAAVVGVVSLLPLAPWAARNWQVFHRFQPLAPRYANEPDEFVPMGFNRWTKTWIADYASVEEVYWAEPGSEIDARDLPSRAFDNAGQQEQTVSLIRDYNTILTVTPELDQRFDMIAAERIRAHPARYYVGLPLLRIADMWLRPRTENLPSDSRWWEFNDEPKWSALAVAFGAINLFYVIFAAVGWLRFRRTHLLGFLLAFVILRSAFLGTLENPEPRYTLEMYPVIIALASAALACRQP